MSHEAPENITYLLRLWRAGSAEESGWRAMVEDPRSGERQVFADLSALFAFLEWKTRKRTIPEPRQPPG